MIKINFLKTVYVLWNLRTLLRKNNKKLIVKKIHVVKHLRKNNSNLKTQDLIESVYLLDLCIRKRFL